MIFPVPASQSWALWHPRPASKWAPVGSQASAGEWMRYVTTMVLGGLVNYGAYAALLLWLPLAMRQPWLGVAFGSLAGMAVNYYTSSRFVFAR